jgi:hypothetical protein
VAALLNELAVRVPVEWVRRRTGEAATGAEVGRRYHHLATKKLLDQAKVRPEGE